MHPSKALYIIIFFGSIAYFFLYGLIVKKTPIITISYSQDSLEDTLVWRQTSKENTNLGTKKATSKNSFEANSTVHDPKAEENSELSMENFLLSLGNKNETPSRLLTTTGPQVTMIRSKKNSLITLMDIITGQWERPGQDCVPPRRGSEILEIIYNAFDSVYYVSS